jgi:hypothetical protein
MEPDPASAKISERGLRRKTGPRQIIQDFAIGKVSARTRDAYRPHILDFQNQIAVPQTPEKSDVNMATFWPAQTRGIILHRVRRVFVQLGRHARQKGPLILRHHR